LIKLSAKVPFGYFGIPLFSFFKILTLNRNINSVIFGLFLTVHHVLIRLIAFSCWIQTRWNFWDISTSSQVINESIYDFLIVRWFFRHKVLFYKKFLKFEADKLASFWFFSLRAEDLSSYDNCTLVKIKINNVTWSLSYLSNNTFWTKNVLNSSLK
jgi:hypothetical protein